MIPKDDEYVCIVVHGGLAQLNSIHIIVLRCPSAGTRPDLAILFLGFLHGLKF